MQESNQIGLSLPSIWYPVDLFLKSLSIWYQGSGSPELAQARRAFKESNQESSPGLVWTSLGKTGLAQASLG